MSLLETMRQGQDSTFMQVVLGLIVVSFIYWGVAPSGDQVSAVATVNGVPVSNTEYARMYRMAERQAEQGGRTLSEADVEDLKTRVRQGLIEREVLLQAAQAYGVEVSDAEIAKQIFDDPNFQGEDGKFSKEVYETTLKRMRITRSDYQERIREGLMSMKLQDLVTMGVSLSEPVLEAAWLDQNTKVDVRFVRVRAQAIAAGLEVSDADVDTFLKDHADQVKAAYDRDLPAKYDLKEKVKLEIIALKVQEGGPTADELKTRLEGVRAEAEAGGDFAALARRWSEDVSASRGGDLGEVAADQLTTEAQAGLKDVAEGKLSPVITESGDVRFYRVGPRTPARVIPLEEVQREIAKRLVQEQRAAGEAAKIAKEQLLVGWQAAKEPPAELLAKYTLTAQTTGPIPVGGGGGLFRPPAAMMKAVRSAKPGDVLPEVYTDDDVLWVGQLVSREEADRARYEAEKDALREQALRERRYGFFEAWRTALVSRATIE